MKTTKVNCTANAVCPFGMLLKTGVKWDQGAKGSREVKDGGYTHYFFSQSEGEKVKEGLGNEQGRQKLAIMHLFLDFTEQRKKPEVLRDLT